MPTNTVKNHIKKLQTNMQQLMSEFDTALSQGGLRTPRREHHATEDEHRITIELPGVNKQEIDVTVSKTTVLVEAHHEDENRHTERHYTLEHTVPQDADTDNLDATYNNGILTLRFPRLHETHEKKIDIQ